MPSKISRRGKKGIWWYFGHWNGVQHRFSLKTTEKHQAQFEQRQYDAKFCRPTFRRPKRKNPTCKAFWSDYVEWMREHREPATLRVQSVFWKQLMDFTKAKHLGDITKQDLEAFKRFREANGIAQQSINNSLKDYQAMFNRAIKEGWYTGGNPATDVERYTIEQTLPEWHSKEALEALANAAEHKSQNLYWTVLLAAYGGLRKRELVYLRWETSFDWDIDKPLIKVVSHDEFRIKTHHHRHVPMARIIYDAMVPHKKASGYVFESNRSSEGKHRYRWDCKRSLQTTLKQAGLSTQLPFQRLRITFGSMHIRRGRPYGLVAAWMGNSERVIRRHYQGLLPYDSAIDDL